MADGSFCLGPFAFKLDVESDLPAKEAQRKTYS